MVLYFSGTGNSRYAAEMIAGISGDEVVSIGERIKKGDTTPIASEKPLVFVCPVYAGRIPKVAQAHIEKTTFTGNQKAYFVVTCAGSPWVTQTYLQKLCTDMGFTFQGFASVVMPQNYIVMGGTKPKEENDKVVRLATPKIQDIALCIKQGKPLPAEALGKKVMSTVFNPIMYKMMIKAKPFHTTSACIGCGQCAVRCPLNNITLQSKKPVWGKTCTHCMACIGGCPKGAIEYGKKSVGKPRYYNTMAGK